MFRSITFFLIVFLLSLDPNHLNGQNELVSSYLIVPDAQRNEITMAPGVIINHSMIERFLTVNFPADRMGFRNMMMTKSMDSIRVVLQSEMRRNVELVSGSKMRSENESSSED